FPSIPAPRRCATSIRWGRACLISFTAPAQPMPARRPHRQMTQLDFEVRMTACDRPAMLRRALHSLQAQSYPHWKAVVYDDSSSPDSRDVVAAIADARIIYQRNSQRLGAVRNVDQCVAPMPVFAGDYGCLL